MLGKKRWRLWAVAFGSLFPIAIASGYLSDSLRRQQTDTWRQDHGTSAPVIRILHWLDPSLFASLYPQPKAPTPSPTPEALAPRPTLPIPNAPQPRMPVQTGNEQLDKSAIAEPPSDAIPKSVPLYPAQVEPTAAQAAAAAVAGCVPGHWVAARQSVQFSQVQDEPSYRADAGDILQVADGSPVSGDQCFVMNAAGDRHGAVPISSIGPKDIVEAEVATRYYNDVQKLSPDAFGPVFQHDLALRAQKLGMKYYDSELIPGLIAIVNDCARLSATQISDMSSNAAEGSTLAFELRACRAGSTGFLFMDIPRGIDIYVERLRDDDLHQNFEVRLVFQDIGGSSATNENRQSKEYLIDRYSRLGIGLYEIESNTSATK